MRHDRDRCRSQERPDDPDDDDGSAGRSEAACTDVHPAVEQNAKQRNSDDALDVALRRRIQGWQRIHSYLEEGPPCPYHAAMGWETCPKIHIFKNCMKLFKELADLPHSRTGNPEDSDPKAVDHAADALRYLTVNLGNDSRFHWPEATVAEVTLDPKLEGPVQHPYGYNTIGGFPILGPSGNPWEL